MEVDGMLVSLLFTLPSLLLQLDEICSASMAGNDYPINLADRRWFRQLLAVSVLRVFVCKLKRCDAISKEREKNGVQSSKHTVLFSQAPLVK
uniref:Secreted protein n=1 Tax=Oryza brachyantha TaxID=4533 RepID=J3MIJ4_ORYBR